MFGFKLLAVAALACAVIATESCAPVVTVTVTVKPHECEPVDPGPTPPGSYMSSIAPPASSVESTVTAPLNSHSPTASTAPPVASPPAAPTSGASGTPPSSGAHPAPPASDAPSSGLAPSPSASVLGTTAHPSSTAAVTRPNPSSSAPATATTNGAIVVTPYIGMGSLFAAGVAAMAVVA